MQLTIQSAFNSSLYSNGLNVVWYRKTRGKYSVWNACLHWWCQQFIATIEIYKPKQNIYLHFKMICNDLPKQVYNTIILIIIKNNCVVNNKI